LFGIIVSLFGNIEGYSAVLLGIYYWYFNIQLTVNLVYVAYCLHH